MGDADIERGEADGLPFLFRSGQEIESPTVCLLHGLGGDENSMWVFAHAFPPGWGLLAPRALYPYATGYSWTENGPPSRFSAFDDASRRLRSFIPMAAKAAASDPETVVWVGFSQGAALAVSALLRGVSGKACAMLSGFVPEGAQGSLPALPVFWAHGRRDRDVPLARARADADLLLSMGAQVEFCEADVDHRVGAACTSALSRWLRALPIPSADRPSRFP
ncbi:MAG TPA: hypothetical protein VFI11_04250 [Anaerolineales bacterium]|nr:hypothetical protein [Anaerolineales bacterium]